jgi:hypothetical protein
MAARTARTDAMSSFVKRARGDGPLVLTTEMNRWKVYYGDALGFTFFANGRDAANPLDSRLVQIEFYYSMPYRGGELPTIANSIDGDGYIQG